MVRGCNELCCFRGQLGKVLPYQYSRHISWIIQFCEQAFQLGDILRSRRASGFAREYANAAGGGCPEPSCFVKNWRRIVA